MEQMQLDLLKQDIAEKLSIVTYLTLTTSCVNNKELLEFVKGVLEDVIDNLTLDNIEVEE